MRDALECIMTKPLEIDVENEGRWFYVHCAHEGCTRYTRMKLVCASMGYFENKKYGKVDLRNQEFKCENHNKEKMNE